MAELILALKDRELSRHALGANTRIGRDPDSDITIDNVGVSRLHATISQYGTTFTIKDEGSANGLHVNGQRVALQALRDGDVVQIGKFSLRLNMAGEGSAHSLKKNSIAPPSRDMAKTFHLDPTEVQKLVAEQRAARAGGGAEDDKDNSMTILVIGLLVIAVIAVVAYFVLIR
jgi:pSer/pThr/pTyr-binding forkhead associated (FHA) protein